MKKRSILVGTTTALALLALGGTARAGLVVNGSFEAPITSSWNTSAPDDWTLEGSGGVWQPSLYAAAGLGPADGNQIGYLNGGKMWQDLGALQANTTYSLSVQVAGRTDGLNPGTDYSVALYAGSSSGTLLTSVTPVVPLAGIWTTLTASYLSGSVPSVDLFVVISSPGAQLDFDNVVVSAVPEPTTMIAGIGALGLLLFGARVHNKRSVLRIGK